MKKRNPYFKLILILLSLLTIISLFYFKLVYISNADGINYYPFYKTMTYLDYAETTVPAFFELIALICIAITFIFLGISRFRKKDFLLTQVLGGLQLLLVAIVVTNIVTFKIIHQDIGITPGPTIVIILLNALLALIYGIPKRKLTKQDETTVYIDSSQIRPMSEIIKESVRPLVSHSKNLPMPCRFHEIPYIGGNRIKPILIWIIQSRSPKRCIFQFRISGDKTMIK